MGNRGALGVPARTPEGFAGGCAAAPLAPVVGGWISTSLELFCSGGRSCFSGLPTAPGPQSQAKQAGGSQRRQSEQEPPRPAPNTQERCKFPVLADTVHLSLQRAAPCHLADGDGTFTGRQASGNINDSRQWRALKNKQGAAGLSRDLGVGFFWSMNPLSPQMPGGVRGEPHS